MKKRSGYTMAEVAQRINNFDPTNPECEQEFLYSYKLSIPQLAILAREIRKIKPREEKK